MKPLIRSLAASAAIALSGHWTLAQDADANRLVIRADQTDVQTSGRFVRADLP
ncbi:MAG: hypothetical protein KIS67_26755 [Verrucomicrobiae bacterium]|nr:hypothetical protein [Verrucomicrobiae bacterium]